jgi:hypothetical protein
MDNAHEVAAHLRDLLRREQGAMADFLVALAGFDERRLWVGLGHTSLFYFLHRELKLSAGAAYHRKTAAALIQRFPEVIEPLRDGRLCLSSVCELAKVVTTESLADVLPRFFHASKQQAKIVAAEIAPLEVVPQRTVVTALASNARPSTCSSPAPETDASPALELGQALVGWPGALPPRAPTDPDVRISRIRLFGLRIRWQQVEPLRDSRWRKWKAGEEHSPALHGHRSL